MNIGVWIGLLGGLAIVLSNIIGKSAGQAFVNGHGILVVVGGTFAAMLISTPIGTSFSALKALLRLLLPQREMSVDEAVAEGVRLARVAQGGGGLLALRDEGRGILDGFVNRAIMVAISTGESDETRRIMEKEIKHRRLARQEDANFWRTVSVLSPMFGIMGTLLGMIHVLSTLSDPSKMGPYMALALSSAFIGIGMANLLCVPVAGQLRLTAMRETLILEIVLEGVLDITSGKAPYLVELHLASYSEQRRLDMASGLRSPEAAA
ncbi:MAG: MotA/TolQ/ExbB proton channel family protein [Elusimicrobiota bacterium]|jgi:chemotaxis protein MotA